MSSEKKQAPGVTSAKVCPRGDVFQGCYCAALRCVFRACCRDSLASKGRSIIALIDPMDCLIWRPQREHSETNQKMVDIESGVGAKTRLQRSLSVAVVALGFLSGRKLTVSPAICNATSVSEAKCSGPSNWGGAKGSVERQLP